MSKKLNTAQRNYSITERECLAVILGVERFRCYLELQEFEVITDHPIEQTLGKVQGHKFSISYRKGKEYILVVPDALSSMYSDDWR